MTCSNQFTKFLNFTTLFMFNKFMVTSTANVCTFVRTDQSDFYIHEFSLIINLLHSCWLFLCLFLLLYSIGDTILIRRCRVCWGGSEVWNIYPRSESSWLSLLHWWRVCASRPHNCWEASSTQHCNTSPPLQGPGDFWAADEDEITEKFVVEHSWIWNWHLLLMASQVWRELWLSATNSFQL